VCRDVDAIDVNMGCPKHFSISGGMGAALLCKPDTVHEILTTLVRNLPVPVTCKIRLRESVADSIELVRRIEKTGVSAITIHGRQRDERPKDPCRWAEIKAIVQSGVSIPVIANGDCFSYADVQRMKEATSADSIMIARAAQWNVSVFRKEGLLPLDDIMIRYIKKAVDFESAFSLTKFTVMEMLANVRQLPSERGQKITHCRSMSELTEIFDLQSYYKDALTIRKPPSNTLGQKHDRIEKQSGDQPGAKRDKRD